MSSGFSCMLCGSSGGRVWMNECPDFYLQRKERVNYLECADCRLIQQSPLPDDVAALYADYPVHSSRNTVQRLARRIFQQQVYFRPARSSGALSLLDYGCGDGTFLREMAPRFGTVTGFEPDPRLAADLTDRLGVPVYSSSEILREERAGMMDVITAHFVLEHVADLREAFETFQILLKPRGALYIAVPNIRSWEARLFKQYWHGLDAPRHLVFPEAAHFQMLASEFGFGAPQISFAAFPNTLAASLSAVLTGRCHALLMMGFILPSWLIALAAPQGTLVVRMIRKDAGDGK